jgi:aryl-phospho-beta-D-glucosidase BglC (GH1 family)
VSIPSDPQTTAITPSPILKGINLSGFSDRKEFYHPATQDQMDFYKSKGMNFFRIPIWWDRLQPTPSAPFDSTVWGEVQENIRYALEDLDCTVMINNHCMGGRKVAGIKRKLGDPQLPYATIVDFWTRIAAEYKNESKVWFDLINEPHDLPINGHTTPTHALVAIYNETIAAIRAEGAKNRIVLEGNDWNNAKYFNQNPWYNPGTKPPTSGAAFVLPSPPEELPPDIARGLGIKDTEDHWCVSCHNYPDTPHGDGGRAIHATILRKRFQNVMDWSAKTGIKVICGEWSAIVADENGKDPNGEAVTKDYLEFFKDNPGKVLAWAWWDGRKTTWQGETLQSSATHAPRTLAGNGSSPT